MGFKMSCWNCNFCISKDSVFKPLEGNIMENESKINAHVLYLELGALQRKQFQNSEFTMEVGGWVQVSLGYFFLENHPKIALNQY